MQYKLIAVVVLSLFLSSEAVTDSRHAGSRFLSPVEEGQVIYNRELQTYDLLVGEFTLQTIGGVERYRPTGDGDHFLEYSWADSPEVTIVVELDERGELWIGDDWILLDRLDQGRVEVEGQALNAGSELSPGLLPCDAIITDVKEITFTGGCWGTTRIEGGTILKKCDSDNDQGCVASVEHGDDEVSEYTWVCDEKKDKYVHFNGDTGVALIEHAESGPGC